MLPKCTPRPKSNSEKIIIQLYFFQSAAPQKFIKFIDSDYNPHPA